MKAKLLLSLLFSFIFMHSAVALQNEIPIVPDDMSFYIPPSTASFGKHGKLIKIASIKTDVPQAKAWKILYWSKTSDDKVVPVSGIVIAPNKPSAKGPRPVITWGHGTSGLPRQCAPSMVANPARDAVFYFLPNSNESYDYGVPSLKEMIDSGYVVVATDYNGLGAPGIHQYLNGVTEARNMLDAAIAVQQLTDAGAGKNVVAMGWSQGGQGAVWTAQIADYLEDQATLLGAVAMAPVNALEQTKIMEQKLAQGEKLRPVSAAERLMGWYAMTLVYPELKMRDVLTPQGIEYFAKASTAQCAHHMSDSLAYFEQYSGPVVLDKPTNQDAWMKRYEENSLGVVPAKVPLAIFQGEQDQAVYAPATTAYVKKACSQGSTVAYYLYQGIDHVGVSSKARNDFLPWIADRLEGKTATSTCVK